MWFKLVKSLTNFEVTLGEYIYGRFKHVVTVEKTDDVLDMSDNIEP